MLFEKSSIHWQSIQIPLHLLGTETIRVQTEETLKRIPCIR
jgi:hypothetical protein